jgi:branched-chain amino acid transport system ATP-binding protein
MSVEKNLTLGAYVHRRDRAGIRKTLEEVYEMFPILLQKKDDPRARCPAAAADGGTGPRADEAPARAAARRAVAGSGAAGGQADVRDHPAHQPRGTTVLLAEQNAYAALGIAHRAYVIENGHIVMEGDRDTLLKDEGIRKAYIGG